MWFPLCSPTEDRQKSTARGSLQAHTLSVLLLRLTMTKPVPHRYSVCLGVSPQPSNHVCWCRMGYNLVSSPELDVFLQNAPSDCVRLRCAASSFSLCFYGNCSHLCSLLTRPSASRPELWGLQRSWWASDEDVSTQVGSPKAHMEGTCPCCTAEHTDNFLHLWSAPTSTTITTTASWPSPNPFPSTSKRWEEDEAWASCCQVFTHGPEHEGSVGQMSP